jgi:hypothetical protein
MGMYAYQKPQRFEGLRQQISRVMAGFELTKLGDSQTVMDAYHFGTIATWLIRHGSNDRDAAAAAAHLTEQAIRWCIERPQNHVGPKYPAGDTYPLRRYRMACSIQWHCGTSRPDLGL